MGRSSNRNTLAGIVLAISNTATLGGFAYVYKHTLGDHEERLREIEKH